MNIYVGNLPFEVNEAEVRELFVSFGQVRSVDIVKDKITNKPRGFCFVEIADEFEAKQIINDLNGQLFKGRKLKVDIANPQKPHPVSDLISCVRKTKRAKLDETESEFWHKIEINFPGFLINFRRIAETFNLTPVFLEESIIENIFGLSKDEIPDRGRGTYAALTDDNLILLIDAFYRYGKPNVDCWRARVIRYDHKRIIRMPRKEGSKGYTKKNTWREIFEDFMLEDLRQMIYALS